MRVRATGAAGTARLDAQPKLPYPSNPRAFLLKLPIVTAACCLTLAFVACGSPNTYNFEDPSASAGDGQLPEGGTDGTGGTSQPGGGAAGTSSVGGTTDNDAGAGGDVALGGGGSGGGGSSGEAGQAGQGGEGGAIDPPEPPDPGRPGQGVVSGGRLMSSASFTLWTSVGDSPSGNGVISSPNYRLVLGVVGTTQP